MKHQTQTETLKTLIALRERARDQEMLGEVVRIPVSNYTEPDVLEREMATVFRKYPMVAGHASHVRKPGAYLLSDWNKIPYVVVRAQDGTLRAFLNACRHRGARLVSGKEPELKSFVCPFHGWTYNLDGSLKTVTKAYAFPDLDRCKYGLVELPVAEHMGLIWIHPTPGASLDPASYLGPFADDLEHFGIDGLVSYRKNVVIKKANWKLLLKTYLEGYHVPFLHRDTLQQAFKRGVIAHAEHGPHIRLAAARTNFMDALKIDSDSFRLLDYASVYYTLFPNTFFIMHPDYVSINAFYPEAPDRTIWTHEMLYRTADFQGERGGAALAKRFQYTNDAVFDAEDFAVAEDVQVGLRYGGNEFHTLGLEEGLLAIFQQSIDRAIAG
ncbi:aromatic ring-hydroxylating dioxygenase subunit alpha [Stigmatella sp. ncwal1]|uniref:Aromatic ring-hydroxylating dioxygenase subunit alpha n=1 Tax=Stigmatella ashevillensis TaxID=2995309 RepID=A0ABT5DP65_9BACT|nr:aromatic ring-hydroxylating dioxygenase subunit alpha [Stigmatella ashevillena]MDC0714528.1 aromatic ring-hydroxylating dioxygenase subunit alpha [Stigmatella ashevillena]